MSVRAFFLSMALAVAMAVSPAPARMAIAAEEGPVAGTVPGGSLGATSDAEFWREIRRGQPATISIPDPEAAVLIQSEGENWRNIRNGPISLYGGWLLLGLLILISVYFAIRGRITITEGRSGKKILRFTQWQRIAHWFAAALFVLLSVTGLMLLYGRYGLREVIGPEAFSAVASASMQAHNLFGPLFLVATVILFIYFLRGNFLALVDLKWIVKGGGFLGGHASSHFYNFAEKAWFWMAVLLGLVLSVTGLVLEFPWLLESRLAQQLAHIAHATSALLLVAVGLGHIYLGAIGVEGALEGMTSGEVDANWAKDHHDLWYDDVVKRESAKAAGE